MKYRYIMSGSFIPEKYEHVHDGTDHRLLCIEIPAPYARNNENEAKKDGQLSYRFVSVEGEVLIAVYPGEDFELATDDNGRKCLSVWTKGVPFHFYNYDEFKRLGGMIYEMPSVMISDIPELGELSEEEMIAYLEKRVKETETTPWDAGDYEAKATFTELFPSLTPKSKPVYIDDEAYCIVEEL